MNKHRKTMGKRLIFSIISSILGLYVAGYLVSGFEIKGGLKALLIGGLLLGATNFFIKPALKLITFPLRIITLGIFNFVINMFLVWAVIDVIMWQYIEITGLASLFWTTVVIWCSGLIFSTLTKK